MKFTFKTFGGGENRKEPKVLVDEQNEWKKVEMVGCYPTADGAKARCSTDDYKVLEWLRFDLNYRDYEGAKNYCEYLGGHLFDSLNGTKAGNIGY